MHSEEPETSSIDVEDASTVRAIKRRFGPAERAVMGAVLAVGAFFAATKGVEAAHTAKRRHAMIDAQAAASVGISPADIALPDRVADWTVKLATQPWAGDYLSARVQTADDAARYFAQPGVYLRLASTMAGDPHLIHIAALTSAKDALASCLFVDLQKPKDDETTAFVPCDADSGCAGDATGNVHNLRELHRGLDVISAQFREDLESADAVALFAMSGELTWRVKEELPRSAKLAAATSYAVVVVDEVPKGFALPWYETSLQAVQAAPHGTRVAVFDAHTGETVLRVRVEADRAVAAALNPEVGRQEQSCGVGLDVAQWMRKNGRDVDPSK